MSLENVALIIEQELEGIPGWCSIEKGKRMAELARGASLCVELGVFGGRGIISLALSLEEQGFGRADGIDPFTAVAALDGTNDVANDEWWRNVDFEEVAKTAQDAICELGLYQYTRLVRLRSKDVVGFYGDGTVDVLHQDSNHAEEVSREEVRLWAPKIRVGGYWIFDDTNWASTQRAQLDLVSLGFTEIEDHGSWKVYRRS